MKQRDLSKLTKEQKLQLIDLLEEKERRARESAAIYQPNKGQIQVHRSAAKIRVVTAGNGSGKTALICNEILWRCTGYNPVTKEFTPVPARVIVLLSHPDKTYDSILPELRKWHNFRPEQLRQRGKPYLSQIVFDNGSEVLFLFHHMDSLAFESLELDFLAADEPFPKPIWTALLRGGRKKDVEAKFLLVGTPIQGAWLRKDLVEPALRGDLPDTEVFKYGTVVNKANLSDNYIEDFSRHLSVKEREIRLEGAFFDLDGLALAHLWDNEAHLVEPFEWSDSQPCVVAIDPHVAKPHHACLLGVDKEGFLYYIKEIRLKAVARDFARALRQWYNGYRVIDIVCDSLGQSEYSGGEGFKSFIQILNEEGIRARSTTWDEKSDEDFIGRIQEVLKVPVEKNSFGLQTPKLRIFKGNTGIVSDIQNVSWTQHRGMDEFKPKLDITNKDFLSCLKYALSTNLVPNKGKANIYRPNSTPYVARQSVRPQMFKRRGRNSRGMY